MCEMPSAYSEKTRKARKEHKCCECGETIKKGAEYQYTSGVWDGRPDSFKQCINCAEIMHAATLSADYCDEVPCFCNLRDWFDNYRCRGFDGIEWLNGMAEQIQVEPEKLNKLLRA